MPSRHRAVRSRSGRRKVSRVMREYKKGTLHSGSKRGPPVRSRAQAVAIALSEGRKAETARRKKRKKR